MRFRLVLSQTLASHATLPFSQNAYSDCLSTTSVRQSGANLKGANLSGANLNGADLRGDVLTQAIITAAIVPDCTIYKYWKIFKPW